MASHAHEFNCTNCNFFNYPMLRESMNGNYTIVCGNCGHHHYRVIKMGVVTEDRHSRSLGEAEIIHVMKSATSKEKRQRGIIAQMREKFAAGFGTGGGE